MEWGIYREHMGHSPQVKKGREKKFYLINWSFFGVFGVYLVHFTFHFRYDSMYQTPKIAYLRQSKVLVNKLGWTFNGFFD